MNLEEIIGKITTIDPVKGTLVVDSWDGKYMSTHPFHIMPELDVVLRKQKPGYFVQISHDGELARGIKFANKPADWPQGKGNFKPRNERLIVVQVLVKAYTDLVLMSFNPENMDFDIARKLVLDAVEQDIDRVMKIGGEGK
jgi:hypothetical protein